MPLKGEAEDICGYVLMFTDETEEISKVGESRGTVHEVENGYALQ